MKAQERLTASEMAMYIGQQLNTEHGIWTIIGVVEGEVIVKDEELNTTYSIGSNMQLLLRPLSDMTEEEACEIATIIYGKPDSVKWRVEKNKITNAFLVYKKHFSKRFVLCLETGEIECYDMDGGDEQKDIYNNQHYVTKYLIEKGFDVFNLIPERKALDKTKRGND